MPRVSGGEANSNESMLRENDQLTWFVRDSPWVWHWELLLENSQPWTNWNDPVSLYESCRVE